MTEPRPRVQIDCGPVSRTHQSFKDECDVNITMKRFANGGVLPTPRMADPTYGDYSNAATFLDAQLTVKAAIADFMRLPVDVRTACKNDPGEFLAMCADPARKEELVKLGLIEADLPKSEDKAGPEVPAGEAKEGTEAGGTQTPSG